MRKAYHICLSSHAEVLFRDDADFAVGFNYLAEAVCFTDSRLLSDGLMSSHWHIIVLSENPKALVKKFRYAYTRYFNAKYNRTGRLGEKEVFFTVIEGIHRLTAALNYVNRQGLHHGVTATPFGYPHCSANAFFRDDLGRHAPDARSLILPERRHRYLLKETSVPKNSRMHESGLLLREDVLDTAYVEQVYLTARNYLYQMNKLSGERSLDEQKKEDSDTPLITIDLIEKGTPGFDVKRMLTNEQGRINKTLMTDKELCELIDDIYVPRIKRGAENLTLYACSRQERIGLAETIATDLVKLQNARIQDRHPYLGRSGLVGKTVSEAQLRRCLAI